LRPALAIVAAALLISCTPTSGPEARQVPRQLDDRAFWDIVTSWSEPNGAFPATDIVSNELGVARALSVLESRQLSSAAYLGVGPEQNFTYIAALQPRIAFVVDIRRSNMLLQLMYKALFELSVTRAEFLSRLFSRHVAGAEAGETAEQLLSALNPAAPTDTALYEKTRAAIRDRLGSAHHFRLSAGDWGTVDHLFNAFMMVGPDIRYDSVGRPSDRYVFPRFRDVMVERDAQGREHSYLASEERYQPVRDLQLRNLIVPVVGDFGGPRALKSIGAWLRNHDATVGVFYTSNVEQYLFQGDAWRAFYSNAAALPTDGTSVFVRCVVTAPPEASALLVDRSAERDVPARRVPVTSFIQTRSMAETIATVQSGRIRFYRDVVSDAK
jgi:hypothetical protein